MRTRARAFSLVIKDFRQPQITTRSVPALNHQARRPSLTMQWPWVVIPDLPVDNDRLTVARSRQGRRRVEHSPQMVSDDRSDGVAAGVVAELAEDAGEGELQLVNGALAQHGPLLL